MSFRLGLQIPYFTYGSTTFDIRPTVHRQVQEAEAHGFDAVFVMDHLYQIPILGPAEDPMLEAYTTLGAISSISNKVLLGPMVTGNIYRNPTLTAKCISTLDVLSQGRAILGIGAGWFETEAEDLGFEFGTFAERFERLEEALEIISQMLLGEEVNFTGKWYQAHHAINNPRMRDSLPILIGGQGEKKTLPLAVKYAKYLNLTVAPHEFAHKLEVLGTLLDGAGRSRKDIEVSTMAAVIYEDTTAAARDKQNEVLDYLDTPQNPLTPENRAFFESRQIVGTLDEVVEQIKSQYFDQGLDGIVVNLPGDGWKPGKIAALGDAFKHAIA